MSSSRKYILWSCEEFCGISFRLDIDSCTSSLNPCQKHVKKEKYLQNGLVGDTIMYFGLQVKGWYGNLFSLYSSFFFFLFFCFFLGFFFLGFFFGYIRFTGVLEYTDSSFPYQSQSSRPSPPCTWPLYSLL